MTKAQSHISWAGNDICIILNPSIGETPKTAEGWSWLIIEFQTEELRLRRSQFWRVAIPWPMIGLSPAPPQLHWSHWILDRKLMIWSLVINGASPTSRWRSRILSNLSNLSVAPSSTEKNHCWITQGGNPGKNTSSCPFRALFVPVTQRLGTFKRQSLEDDGRFGNV